MGRGLGGVKPEGLGHYSKRLKVRSAQSVRGWKSVHRSIHTARNDEEEEKKKTDKNSQTQMLR